MSLQQPKVALSIIVPVGARRTNIVELYTEYRTAIAILGCRVEFIFVLDGSIEDQSVVQLARTAADVTVVELTRSFGESTAVMAGFAHAKGELLLVLPAYHQIEAQEIPKLVASLDSADLVVAYRSPRRGGGFERLRRKGFHVLLNSTTGLQFNDLGCGARAMRRQVLEEIQLYGDQSRFLPVLADRQGFRVREVAVKQSALDRRAGLYGPREYARGFLDLFTVFFLVRFTKKPLRFFGMIGIGVFVIGAALITYLLFARLLLDQALADRPALLLSALLVVLGLQLFAMGLLGELIIFTHAGEIKDYKVEKVVHYAEGEAQQPIATRPERNLDPA